MLLISNTFLFSILFQNTGRTRRIGGIRPSFPVCPHTFTETFPDTIQESF